MIADEPVENERLEHQHRIYLTISKILTLVIATRRQHQGTNPYAR